MKIIWFKGQLSNQIFACALYKKLKERYPQERIYGFYHQYVPTVVHEYYQLEIPPKCICSEILGAFFAIMRKVFKSNWMCSTDKHPKWDAIFFDGYWQDLTYYEDFPSDWLKFRETNQIGEKNLNIEKLMSQTNSVAVHVRRGDYLKAKNKKLFGETPTEYFQRAIDYCCQHIENPTFFFFSDDIPWTKQHLVTEGENYYINWNKGKDSYIDQYLMSKAKANIIANSTFSYWAAYITPKELVIYPSQWYERNSGKQQPNLFPKNWIPL